MMPQYPRYKGFPKPTVDCSGDALMTIQSARDEVDINKIVARIEKGLVVPIMNGQPFYGDVSEFSGLQDAIIKVQEANQLFMAYPADIRSRFDNDPIKFVEFMEDPDNTDEAIELGLAVKRPEAKPATPAAPAAEGGNAQ